MTVDEAIAIADNILFSCTDRHLSDLERAVLKGSLQRQKYQEIAADNYQTPRYVKDVGAALWRKLSAALGGESVTKGNIYSVLVRHATDLSLQGASTALPQPYTITADAFAKYRHRYLKYYSQIKILPGLMHKPLPLESIYVEVKVLSKSNVRFLSSTTIEEAYQRFHHRNLFGTELARQDGVLTAQKHQYLMVLGGPGVGKSTFLRKLGLEAFKSGKLCLPILIELRRVATSNMLFEDYAIQSFQKLSGVSSTEFVLNHLKQGSFLLLLDGLDEIPRNKSSQLIDQIHEFVSRYDRNRFVIACRTAAHVFNFNQFIDVIVADFDDGQIKQFIEYWFSAQQMPKSQDGGLAKTFSKQLSNPKNSALKALACSPLLLTYLCLIYEIENEIPITRRSLYSKALKLILEDWDKQKNISDALNIRQSGFTPSLESKLLSEIAYENFSVDQFLFSKKYLLDKIHLFLQKNCRQADLPVASDVFHVMEERQGILVERFSDYFSFSHLTFQEYLTASFVVNNQLIENVVHKHCADNRWREVILLASELMEGRVINLSSWIQQHIDACLISYSKLKRIVEWGNCFLEKSNLETTLSTRASISAAISVIASSRASDFDVGVLAGKTAADSLAKACEIAMTMSKGEETVYKAAVACAVAIACARAIAYDLAESAADFSNEPLSSMNFKDKALSIDEVVHDASEMINSASDDRGLIKNYVRNQVVNKAISFAVALSQASRGTHSLLANIFEEVSQPFDHLAYTVPETSSPANQWYQWAQVLEAIWMKALDVDRTFLLVSVQEAQAWEKYMYLTELLMQCRKTTVYSSLSEYKIFEEQLLS